MSITVKFGSYTLTNVRDVEWSNKIDRNHVVDSINKTGHLTKSIKVNGFILVADPTQNIQAQQALETQLRAINKDTLTYTGATAISDVVFISLSFNSYRGNPFCQYVIEFETESNNPHAFGTVTIGGYTLTPSPAISDKIEEQSMDGVLSSTKNRKFTINGEFEGTQAEINTAQSSLIAAIEGNTTVSLILVAGSYNGTFTVMPHSLDFRAPQIRGTKISRGYTIECSTYEDYTIEPHNLGETPAVFGNITVDLVENFNHTTSFDKDESINAYWISREEVSVSGKKYFVSRSEFDTFRANLNISVSTLDSSVRSTYQYTSTTSNVLELKEASAESFTRDGCYADNSKRYSANIQLTFQWVKGIKSQSHNTSSIMLGLTWHTVSSISINTTQNSQGKMTSKSVSINGKLLVNQYANAKSSLLGTQQVFDSITDLYITSVSLNSIETYYTSIGQTELYNVSVNAAQLDNSTKYTYFIVGLFEVPKTESSLYGTITFDNVTSKSKSISHEYDDETDPGNKKFIVSSITYSISGEIHAPDTGSGTPDLNNGIENLFNAIDANMQFEISNRTSPYTFMLTNISVGGWQAFSHPVLVDANGYARTYWKQSVSVSATVNFTENVSGSSQPVSVDTESFTIGEQVDKFVPIQVMGYGVIYKKVGIIPATATSTIQRQFRDQKALAAATLVLVEPTLPTSFPLNESDTMVTKNTTEVRGNIYRKVKSWQAKKSV